jgi:CRP/FNR family cyclic AMP-dependent transcriptional regulator
VAVRTVEGTLNGMRASNKGRSPASVLRNRATPEAARVRPTGATQPLQVRQRPSTAFVRDIRTSGCTGLTGRSDRASGRCLLFTGRQMVSTAASRSSAVAQEPSHEPTKAKPRPLKATQDNHSERSQEHPDKRRCLPLTSLGGTYLNSAGLWRKVTEFRRNEIIFTQGDPSKNVMFIREGNVKLTVVNAAGNEAVVAILGPGDFLGEGCLAGQSICMATATAITPTTVLVIEKHEMMRVLHGQHEFSDWFIAYMLARNIRVEEDLIDQLFNSSEKRLARALLLLARYGEQSRPQKMLPKVSQEMLAEMIGTTRPRINLFMNKFRKLGFIEYGGRLRELQINKSLLSVVLQD